MGVSSKLVVIEILRQVLSLEEDLATQQLEWCLKSYLKPGKLPERSPIAQHSEMLQERAARTWKPLVNSSRRVA